MRGVAYDWHTVERMVGYLEFLLLLTVQSYKITVWSPLSSYNL